MSQIRYFCEMSMIDSHCHLYLPEFKEDIDEVIKRAKESHVDQFFLPNIDSSTTAEMLALTSQYPGICFPMMGLHPTSVKGNFEEELNHVEQELNSGKYVAVGEIGIDLYWDKTYLKEQVISFERQIEWAKEMKKPIVIHARDSFDEIFESVDKLNEDRLTGIFHCFTGNLEQARHILSYGGFKMGIGGVVTFKNGGLDKFLAEVPLENLVLETDSPYLAPAPNRGKRNEPSYLQFVIEKLSEIYGQPVDEIMRITRENTLNVFKMSWKEK